MKKIFSGDTFIQIIPPIILLFLWEVCSYFGGEINFPHSYQIIHSVFTSFNHNAIIEAQGGGEGGFLPHIIATFANFILGLSLGLFLGIFMAIMIFEYNDLIGVILEPILEILRIIPPLVMVPFILVIFGATQTSQIIITTIYCSYSICIYVLNGLKNIEKDYLYQAQILGSNSWQKIKMIYFPGFLPELLGGLRITSGLSLGILIVAEYMGSPSGIGRVMKFAISYTNLELIIVGVFWAIILALISDRSIVFIFKYLLKWTYRKEA